MFVETIEAVSTGVSAIELSEKFLPTLVMENFRSGTNELLMPTTQGYDQPLKIANQLYITINLNLFLKKIFSFYFYLLRTQEEKNRL